MIATSQYPNWKQTYSNEDFDRASRLATKLTAVDRFAGVPSPAVGYSEENFQTAWEIVKAAQS